ncbi:hypothetical protein [Pedobacter cryoconitis]|uniref:Putative ATP-binding protein involved in virulence n=1 Tax=Pedobacter cryoconitis TaxID=188932 RepID=A0A7X0MGQ6_9SPHI|nr:hypothetical protein [Pedobacter cryoconitis]MBB6498031.1 putative ATP-binding protein involved in virulence [Pedobacter cryoconitis]
MKKNYFCLIVLLTGTLLSSCKKSDIVHENDYDTSHKTWTNFKASSNNSYRYTSTSASWTGTSSETTITVKDGRVIQRSYTASKMNQPTKKVTVYEEWIENENNLKTHPKGSDPVTLEEVYQKAKTVWLLKRKDAKTYFETKNNGMISSCGYVVDGCQDDCFEGITIGLIEKL